MSLDELEVWFNHQQIPSEIKLDGITWIADVPKMIQTHIMYLRHNPGNKTFMPYYQRLMQVKHIMQSQK